MIRFALAVALAAVPAQAVVVQFQGTVDQQFGDNSSYVEVGDTVTITIDFDPATQIRDQQHGTDDYWFQKYTPESVFRIETSRGLKWTAADETFDDGVYLTYGQGEPVLKAHTFVKAGQVAPEFSYFGSSFSIVVAPDSPASALSRNFAAAAPGDLAGFGGRIAYVSPAPEPATWAMMIAGFALVSARLRSARRARPFPA